MDFSNIDTNKIKQKEILDLFNQLTKNGFKTKDDLGKVLSNIIKIKKKYILVSLLLLFISSNKSLEFLTFF